MSKNISSANTDWNSAENIKAEYIKLKNYLNLRSLAIHKNPLENVGGDSKHRSLLRDANKVYILILVVEAGMAVAQKLHENNSGLKIILENFLYESNFIYKDFLSQNSKYDWIIPLAKSRECT